MRSNTRFLSCSLSATCNIKPKFWYELCYLRLNSSKFSSTIIWLKPEKNLQANMKLKAQITTSIAAIMLFSTVSNAIIIGGDVTDNNGDFIELTVPWGNASTPDNTVGNDNFESVNLFAFNEDQNVAVAAGGIDPDIGASISAGTIVASHYIVFDPPNTPIGSSGLQIGYVTFDADILAILTSTATLNATDYLNVAGPITYDTSDTLRGIEGTDLVSIDPTDSKKILLEIRAGSPGDSIRVLTAQSPGAPGPTEVPDATPTIMLLAIGIAILCSARIWRN